MNMRVYANAKLNLTLDVLGTRPDGYHELCMVMQSVDLRDILDLELRQDGRFLLQSNLAYLPIDGKNLAVAAAQRFFAAIGQKNLGLSLRLYKQVPVCAGMGGGSSDAAAVLRALNRMTGSGMSPMELAKLGEAVGSDVPYCVLGGTALARGRGEALTPVPSLPDCYAVLCKPAFSISTPELFRQLDSCRIVRRPDTLGMLRALEQGDLVEAARRMYNVFEDVLQKRQARIIREIKNTLIDAGALGACMTGTGPTVFGLFRDRREAEAARRDLSEFYEDVFLCRTCSPTGNFKKAEIPS